MDERLLPDDGLEQHTDEGKDIEEVGYNADERRNLKREGGIFSKDATSRLKEYGEDDEGKVKGFHSIRVPFR